MGCMKCPAGYWECGEGGTECGGGAGGQWTVKGEVKLQIPGGGKLIVDVKARSELDQKTNKHYPRLRLKVKGIESPGKGGIFVGEAVDVDQVAVAMQALEDWSSAHVANRIQDDLVEKLRKALEVTKTDEDEGDGG